MFTHVPVSICTHVSVDAAAFVDAASSVAICTHVPGAAAAFVDAASSVAIVGAAFVVALRLFLFRRVADVPSPVFANNRVLVALPTLGGSCLSSSLSEILTSGVLGGALTIA